MVTLILHHTLAGFHLKTTNIHRVRKDLEKDIFQPLSEKFFQRSYRMNKKSFYILHEIIPKGTFSKTSTKSYLHKIIYNT
jgi:hypothetical protein